MFAPLLTSPIADPNDVASEVTVVLADDSDRFRDGIARALARAEGMRIVAAVADGRQALDVARELLPDVLVVDDRMPGLSGIEATERVTHDLKMLHVRVVLLSANEDPDLAIRARRAGAVASIDKTRSRTQIVSAIRDAAR